MDMAATFSIYHMHFMLRSHKEDSGMTASMWCCMNENVFRNWWTCLQCGNRPWRFSTPLDTIRGKFRPRL